MAKLSPAVRDALVLVAVFAVLLGGLYVYTGTWPPAVIVESGSMMHKECAEGQTAPACDPSVRYGRFGTIDPGDLVLVKQVETVEDVATQVEGGRDLYGKSGDVIVYYPANNRGRTPIIHRAVAYVEVVDGTPNGTQYRVRWDPDAPCVGGATKDPADARWCVYGSSGVYVPEIPIAEFGSTAENPRPYKPIRTGFLTKGDNPSTNTQTDQLSGLSMDEHGQRSPVQLEWIEGKARAELPWLGLIKLSLAGRPNEPNPPATWKKIGSAYAPQDLWVMLGVSLFVLVGIPLIYDGYKAVQNRRKRTRGPPAAPIEVSGRPTGPDGIELTWKPATTGPPPVTYHVYRGANRVGTTDQTTFTETGLEAGVSYLYAVSAAGADGVEGPRSGMLSVATTPPAPAQGT